MVELLIFIALGVLILILFEARERYKAKHPERFPETTASAAEDCDTTCASCAIAEACVKPEKKADSSESDKSSRLPVQD